MISEQDIDRTIGATAIDNGGDKIGDVSEVYFDEATNRPAWATVKTGMFGTKTTFVPLEGASLEGDELRVPFDKATVKDAPKIDTDERLSSAEEEELYRHYGLNFAGRTDGRDTTAGRESTVGERAAGGGTVGRDTSGPRTDDAMTRSEEQLRVGTEQVETGRVRLRKHVVTENVTKTVPVSHEEVHIEREPITDANRADAQAGGEITEEEQEVTLHAERPVVQKEAVPVERVRMDAETVNEQQQVSDTVRKEEIESDGVQEATDTDTARDRRR